jgi:hypothetical protein
MAIPYLACMIATAAFYHLPPRALPAIQVVEGGQVHMASRNTDGSDDLGPMQVNTVWLPWIARSTGLSTVAVRARLIDDPCFNIAAAGAILRTQLDEAHGNLLVAIGHYHSHTPERAAAYRIRVVVAAMRLFYPGRAPGPGQASGAQRPDLQRTGSSGAG